MNLQVLTQAAQIAGPVIAAIAAMFSAVSSRAAVRAVRMAQDSQTRSEIADSRGRRANLNVEIEPRPSPWPVVLIVKNEDTAHSARGLRIRLPGHEDITSEIIPGAYLRVETNIREPQLPKGDFHPGLPAHMRPADAIASAPVLRGELDYLDDLEIRRWRFGVHISETITQTSSEVEHAYSALLFGAPRLVDDMPLEPLAVRKRIGLAWQIIRGRH